MPCWPGPGTRPSRSADGITLLIRSEPRMLPTTSFCALVSARKSISGEPFAGGILCGQGCRGRGQCLYAPVLGLGRGILHRLHRLQRADHRTAHGQRQATCTMLCPVLSRTSSRPVSTVTLRPSSSFRLVAAYFPRSRFNQLLCGAAAGTLTRVAAGAASTWVEGPSGLSKSPGYAGWPRHKLSSKPNALTAATASTHQRPK